MIINIIKVILLSLGIGWFIIGSIARDDKITISFWFFGLLSILVGSLL